MKTAIQIFLLLLLASPSHAQSNKIDSLNHLIAKAISDLLKDLNAFSK